CTFASSRRRRQLSPMSAISAQSRAARMASLSSDIYSRFMIRSAVRIVALFVIAVPVIGLARDNAADPYKKERAEFIRIYASIENGTDTNAAASDALRTYPL